MIDLNLGIYWIYYYSSAAPIPLPSLSVVLCIVMSDEFVVLLCVCVSWLFCQKRKNLKKRFESRMIPTYLNSDTSSFFSLTKTSGWWVSEDLCAKNSFVVCENVATGSRVGVLSLPSISSVHSIFFSIFTKWTREYLGGWSEALVCVPLLPRTLDVFGEGGIQSSGSLFLPYTGRSELRLSHRAVLLEIGGIQFLVQGHLSG